MPVPIIDLFAGLGGLGERFASLKGHAGKAFFEIGLSFDFDPDPDPDPDQGGPVADDFEEVTMSFT
ncbi:MAG: hypothetical protein KGZ61_05150 [Sandarakinorhabdus sp.]|nr:hypothetical protein [Sandarakinorhabdus sp.]